MASSDTKPLPQLTTTNIENFRSGVAVAGPDECWPWTRSTFRDGYGQMKVRGRNIKAHRVAYFVNTGIDPVGSLVCHTCDNPRCCNPSHLFLGTCADNLQDCQRKGRLNTASGERHRTRTHPELILRGERVGGSKLIESQVREIIDLYMTERFTQQDLADRFGVKRENIGLLLRGKNWKHIPRDIAAIRRIAKQQQACGVSR